MEALPAPRAAIHLDGDALYVSVEQRDRPELERTREIGIRKALGARRRRVLSQFVVEAITLSLLGGLAGVLLGAGLAVGAREIYGVPASVPTWAVALALASASGCGLVFGIYPAIRASRLDPVEAMRAE